MSPHGVYPCLDGEWICIVANNNERWQLLAKAMQHSGLENDKRFRTLADRKINEQALNQLISDWTSSQNASTLAAQLQTLGIAANKSQSSVDLVADGQLWAREFYREVAYTDGASGTIVGPGWKMSRDAKITTGAPRLGEHNAYILGDVLGLSTEDQQKLFTAGITR
jgi:crotonobetainyl-CoA:carnitine CoA-transferase CaiB-like acyl-CoA transferase